MEEKKINLNWKWSEGMKPSGRTINEVIESVHQSVIKENGQLYTEEECIQLVDEIRKELRAKGELS
ncbi:MAG: hypothetical protein K2H45_08630 [Acetatifactor sp.]|nr:hypothetical protein [Acetatifactor sp.]